MPTVFLPYDSVLEKVLDDIGAALKEKDIRVVRGPRAPLPPGQLGSLMSEADAAMLTMRVPCDALALKSAHRLRGLVFPTIGVESLDLASASEMGIIVGHGAMPENYLGLAEATVMLMLMQLYGPQASSDVAHRHRPRPAPDARAVWARMLRGRKVGMVGFGRIGRAIAERLSGWNVDILVSDPYIDERTLPPGVRAAAFEHLLQESDLVLVLVAMTPETKNIIDARAISLMKRDAHLINVSRGEALDEVALAAALRERRIAGAALDVTRQEPIPADSELLKLDNCFVTPHMVGQTKEVFEAIVPTAVANMENILKDNIPVYCKNPEAVPRWRERLRDLESRPHGQPS